MMHPKVLALGALIALIGCQREQPPKESAPAPKARPAAQKPAPTPAAQESTAGMVEAASVGKSQAAVALKFDLMQRPQIGEPLALALAVVAQTPANPATVELSVTDGLRLAAADARFEIPSVEPKQVYRHTVELTPSAEGVLFVTATVTLKHDEVADSKVFTIPVIVPSPTEDAAAPKH